MKAQIIRKFSMALVLVAGMFALGAGMMAQAANDASPSPVPAMPSAPLPSGVADVLKLGQAKISDNTIVAYVQSSGNTYHLDASQIIYLRDQGLSDAVLTAMLSQTGTPAGVPNDQTPEMNPPAPPDVTATGDTTSGSQPTVIYVNSAPVYYYPAWSYSWWWPVGVTWGWAWWGGCWHWGCHSGGGFRSCGFWNHGFHGSPGFHGSSGFHSGFSTANGFHGNISGHFAGANGFHGNVSGFNTMNGFHGNISSHFAGANGFHGMSSGGSGVVHFGGMSGGGFHGMGGGGHSGGGFGGGGGGMHFGGGGGGFHGGGGGGFGGGGHGGGGGGHR